MKFLIWHFIRFFIECLVRIIFDFIVLFTSPIWFVAERYYAKKKKTYKSILITGASSGLGESLAVGFAQPGARLVLTGRNEERLKKVEEECKSKGAEVKSILIDVIEEKGMARVILEEDDVRPFDLVIANAGVSQTTLGEKKISLIVKKIYDINVQGVFNTILPIIPRMRERRYGQIAILSSMASYAPLPQNSEYGSSKAAVRFFAEGLRALLAQDNIGVTAICPAWVRSPMTKGEEQMPFFMETAPALKIMKEELEHNVGVIAYPYATYLAASIAGGASFVWRDAILNMIASPKITLAKLGSILGEQ